MLGMSNAELLNVMYGDDTPYSEEDDFVIGVLEDHIEELNSIYNFIEDVMPDSTLYALGDVINILYHVIESEGFRYVYKGKND